MRLPYYVIKDSIIQQTKDKRNIIYGARAVNRQLPRLYHRPTGDWDIWSKKYKKDAFALERTLDKESKGDNFYTKRLRGVYRQAVYSVYERPKYKIADFTEMPAGSGIYKVIGGIRWQTLKHAKQKYKKILENPRLKFRHEQALWDLWRIEQFEKQLKRRKETTYDMIVLFKVKKKYLSKRW